MKLLTRALDWASGFTAKFWLGLVAALLACLPVAYCKGRSDGRAIEQLDQAKAVAKAGEEQLAKERAAAAADLQTKRNGEGAIAARREEIDDAKADIPDQGLTARQRARSCAELRRAGGACPFTPAAR